MNPTARQVLVAAGFSPRSFPDKTRGLKPAATIALLWLLVLFPAAVWAGPADEPRRDVVIVPGVDLSVEKFEAWEDIELPDGALALLRGFDPRLLRLLPGKGEPGPTGPYTIAPFPWDDKRRTASKPPTGTAGTGSPVRSMIWLLLMD